MLITRLNRTTALSMAALFNLYGTESGDVITTSATATTAKSATFASISTAL